MTPVPERSEVGPLIFLALEQEIGGFPVERPEKVSPAQRRRAKHHAGELTEQVIKEWEKENGRAGK